MKQTILFVLIILPYLAWAQSDKADVEEVVNDSYYGVPSSPAFELLPDKPSEVTHILTPKDITAFVPVTIDGGELKSNVGFDIRPFTYLMGPTSLDDYQQKKSKQILWRSVLSGGTSAIKDSKDKYLALGFRVPIIDKGDPRASKAYNDDLMTRMQSLSAPGTLRQATKEKLQAALDSALDSKRKEFIAENWNAVRLDVGIGNMWLVESSKLKADSIKQNRIGVWAAYSRPLGKNLQFIVSAKNAWIKADADTLETSRASAGARLRAFFKIAAISVEYAKVWSGYRHENSLDEDWDHFGCLVEIPIPKLKGVLGFAYGGDSSRREDKDAKFEFKYSFYADALLEK